ncbi:MAG: hypothetical protein ACK5HS_04555 [Mycoplasmatales bacterium]
MILDLFNEETKEEETKEEETKEETEAKEEEVKEEETEQTQESNVLKDLANDIKDLIGINKEETNKKPFKTFETEDEFEAYVKERAQSSIDKLAKNTKDKALEDGHRELADKIASIEERENKVKLKELGVNDNAIDLVFNSIKNGSIQDIEKFLNDKDNAYLFSKKTIEPKTKTKTRIQEVKESKMQEHLKNRDIL